MSLQRAISTLTVKVNGIEFGIIPKSLEYKDGLPTRDVKGLDNGDVYFTEDREEAVGMIKFEVPTTAENIADVKTIEASKKVTVKFYDDDGYEKVMSSGVSKNDSTKSIGTDAKITLEFMGTPLS